VLQSIAEYCSIRSSFVKKADQKTFPFFVDLVLFLHFHISNTVCIRSLEDSEKVKCDGSEFARGRPRSRPMQFFLSCGAMWRRNLKQLIWLGTAHLTCLLVMGFRPQ